nr:addiction module protein [Desulfobulbaceae bacterium]
MKTKDLITEATSLPVEERAIVIDCLLKSLNQPDTDIEKKWVSVAKKRLEEIRNRNVDVVPGDKVFEKIWSRFAE